MARRGAACLLATVPLVTALAALAGCGEEGEAGQEKGGNSELLREPGGGALVGPEWEEARDYAYTLEQECGENSVTGTFRVTVRDGRVSGWEPVGENHTPRSVEVPSIGGLLAEAEQARQSGAETVEVLRAGDGRPTEVTIDHAVRAIDDEVCYRIRAYRPESVS
ncbi:DUF6174 domain-containing protein [Streptomyces sp. 6N223]|uniref:DUF6174 domain-containing protein n=1 Tax=Streptomyces sp. 6N223 TaxID=3457412 RepID=UPI003FD42D4F